MLSFRNLPLVSDLILLILGYLQETNSVCLTQPKTRFLNHDRYKSLEKDFLLPRRAGCWEHVFKIGTDQCIFSFEVTSEGTYRDCKWTGFHREFPIHSNPDPEELSRDILRVLRLMQKVPQLECQCSEREYVKHFLLQGSRHEATLEHIIQLLSQFRSS